MTASKHFLVLACAALLTLGACTGTKHVRTPDPATEAALAAEKMRADALAEALASLETVQRVLSGPATTNEQRVTLRDEVTELQEELAVVQRNLGPLPESEAKRLTTAALVATNAALSATNEALGATNAALAPGGGGPVALANMHTTLDRAQTAVDAAQAELKTALAAEGLTTELRNLLSQAQRTLATAQLSLVPLLRQELAQAEQAERDLATRTTERDTARAEVDSLTMRFGKDLAIDGREASRLAPDPKARVSLTPRRAGVEWTANAGFVATSPSWGTRIRYTITNYGTASTATRLAIKQDAVPYAATAGMVIPGASGTPSTTEFPGRGEVFRGIGYNHREFVLPRQGSYGPASDGTAANAIPGIGSGSRTGLRGNLRGHAISSFQYDADSGLIMKFGALPPDRNSDGNIDGNEGSLIYGDLEALTATARYNCGPDGDQACDEAGTRDLTVSFGAPSRDPTGDPAYHWTVDVPDPRLTIAVGATATAATPATLADADGIIGRYQALLSNHAGVDDKGTAAAADDSERYLRYAAYGLFQFIDYQTTDDRVGRMQTFHYGFDAFGAHNRLPAATADSIAATFKGRTMAWLATTHGSGVVGGLHRMRGNVTLHACLGGGGCQASDFTAPAGADKPTAANDFNGAIHDLEITLPGGAWGSGGTAAHPSGRYAFLGDILLDGDITANGAFSGRAVPDSVISDSRRTDSDGGTRTAGADTHGYTIREQVGGNRGLAMNQFWNHGGVEGAFYGPADALEAAGTWWLPAVGSDIVNNGVLGMVGSFGAAACPADASNC